MLLRPSWLKALGGAQGHTLSGQPGRIDVGPGWLQLGVCNTRSSLGASNAFTLSKN
jgi:hypothetical protein